MKNLIKHNLLCYCHIDIYNYIQTQKVRFWTYFSNIWISSDFYKLFLIIQYHRSQTKTTKQAHQNIFDLNKNSRQLGTQAHYAKQACIYITLYIFITGQLQQYWQLMKCQWEKSCLKGLFLLDKRKKSEEAQFSFCQIKLSGRVSHPFTLGMPHMFLFIQQPTQ